MTVSVSTFPAYCAAHEPVTLIGTSDLYDDDAVEWELVSTPNASRLPLGKIVERSPAVVRVRGARLTFHAGSTAKGIPARITCNSNNFIEPGFVEGMALSVAASTSNNGNYTIAKVEARTLTLAANDVLVNESATSNLTAQYVGDNGPPSNVLTFDCSGDFAVAAHEFFNFRGQHRLMSKATATISVGEYLELPIETVSGNNSTLRILVVGTVVRRAELVRATSDLARAAALDTTVAAAVTAMEGVAVTSLDLDFESDVNSLCTKYAAHIANTSVHTGSDGINVMLREAANSRPTAIARLSEWATRLLAHQQATTSGGVFHTEDDAKNALQVAPTATTLAQAIVLKADLRERVYRRHLAQTASPASHSGADSANVPASTALTLPAAIVSYLDFIAASTVTAPTGESAGVLNAQASWGFRVA